MPLRFFAHTAGATTGADCDRRTEIENRRSQIGDMIRAMAGLPSMLIGYHELSRAMKRSRLDRSISRSISPARQETIGSHTCR